MNYSSKIILWAIAGQHQEGYNPPSVSNLWHGSKAWRNNNPGNLRKGLYTQGLGATGVDPNNFLIFPNYVSGFFALCQFLTDCCGGKNELYNPDSGLLDFYKHYAPSTDGNYPARYASNVAKFMNEDINTPIKNFL